MPKLMSTTPTRRRSTPSPSTTPFSAPRSRSTCSTPLFATSSPSGAQAPAQGRCPGSGGGKPFRQKGTGRARAGTTRAPHWRGGGVVHGPHPQAAQAAQEGPCGALRCALSRRTEESKLTVFDAFALADAKTKSFAAVMKRFEFGDLLLVLDEKDELVMRSARNIPGVTVLPVAGLNVYDVLKHQNLAMTKSAVERVNARLGA